MIQEKIKHGFRFLNCVVENLDYMSILNKNWNTPEPGQPMYSIWRKLLRLQPTLRQLNRKTTDGLDLFRKIE